MNYILQVDGVLEGYVLPSCWHCNDSKKILDLVLSSPGSLSILPCWWRIKSSEDKNLDIIELVNLNVYKWNSNCYSRHDLSH